MPQLRRPNKPLLARREASHWPSTGVALASVLSSAMLAGFSVYFNGESLKKDYVQLAVSILEKDPADNPAALRQWALDLLSQNSPIPLSDQAKAGLLRERLALPTLNNPTNLKVQ